MNASINSLEITSESVLVTVPSSTCSVLVPFTAGTSACGTSSPVVSSGTSLATKLGPNESIADEGAKDRVGCEDGTPPAPSTSSDKIESVSPLLLLGSEDGGEFRIRTTPIAMPTAKTHVNSNVHIALLLREIDARLGSSSSLPGRGWACSGDCAEPTAADSSSGMLVDCSSVRAGIFRLLGIGRCAVAVPRPPPLDTTPTKLQSIDCHCPLGTGAEPELGQQVQGE